MRAQGESGDTKGGSQSSLIHQHYWSAAQDMPGAAGLATQLSCFRTSIELIDRWIARLGLQRVSRPSFGPMLRMVLVLCVLLPPGSNAQQSGCAATPGTYESATSTIVCASFTSSPPTCEVVFSSLPAFTGLSSFFITIEIANSDFGSSNEYVSAVLVGGQTLGTDFLKDDGADNQCDKMSRILDLTAVPIGAVSSAGDLTSCSAFSMLVVAPAPKSREANGIVFELEIDLGRCNDLHPGDPMRTWQERGYGSACPSESEVWNACAKFCFRIWLTSFSLRMSE
eukprot:Tamp_19612.p1 GENE.Tamp_19612~~Tamp_19612.p1  ORF type:complete len:283 (-),score=28.35 Tamp_19612:58-906(-)